jgi:site-specific recombinase XerD
MLAGACVIRYPGKRGVVWKVKFVDASGRQVKETLGRASDGWTRRRAESELRRRLVDVERSGYRRPEPVTLTSFAKAWLDEYPERKGLKRSTVEGYKCIVESHLIPVLGRAKLGDLDVEALERYVARKRREGLAPRTVNRHLNVLSRILTSAAKRGLVASNPVALVERPDEQEVEWRILAPDEIREVERKWCGYIDEAEETSEERAWRETTRVIFLTVAEAGLRRGEIAGLRWRALALADPEGAYLRVAETIVRGATDTPKSDAGRRTIPISSRLAAELFDHRARSAYDGDDELVFCSPHRGSPLNPKRYAASLRDVLELAGIVDYVRPFHDGRHSSITNAARHGRTDLALMTLAGHSDFRVTKRYVHLAGEMFREEAVRMERALWGDSGTKSRYHEPDPSPALKTEEAV